MRKDARANRDALLDSATRLIAEKGPEVSLREIARDAGVGVATANRHFPDRGSLILAVIEQGTARLTALLTPDAAAWEADPWRAWRNALHGVREANLAGLAEALLGNQSLDLGPLNKAENKRNRILDAVSPIFQLGLDHGFVPANLSPVRFYLGLVTASRPLPAPAQEIDSHAREWITDVYIEGLHAQASRSGGKLIDAPCPPSAESKPSAGSLEGGPGEDPRVE